MAYQQKGDKRKKPSSDRRRRLLQQHEQPNPAMSDRARITRWWSHLRRNPLFGLPGRSAILSVSYRASISLMPWMREISTRKRLKNHIIHRYVCPVHWKMLQFINPRFGSKMRWLNNKVKERFTRFKNAQILLWETRHLLCKNSIFPQMLMDGDRESTGSDMSNTKISKQTDNLILIEQHTRWFSH